MKGIDNFFLPVDDMDKAKEFYQKIGLKVKFDFSDKGMAAFQAGNEEAAVILKVSSKFPDAKPAVWFVVDDVRQEYQSLLDKGVRFLGRPFPIGTGTAVEFEDPFGNRLGIADYRKS